MPVDHQRKEPRRGRSILEDPPAGLARRAVRDRVLLEIHATQRLAAAGARLAEVPVDAVHAGVPFSRETKLEAAGEVVVDRAGQRRGLLVPEIGRQPEGVKAAPPSGHPVRVRAPDAGERALVPQQRVELAPFPAEDPAQGLDVDLEGVGAEVCELRVELLRVLEEPDSGALPSFPPP